MRGLACLALCGLLAMSAVAHDVDDDFDDEAEVEEEAAEGMDTVTVEKVTTKTILLQLTKLSCQFTIDMKKNRKQISYHDKKISMAKSSVLR